MDALSPDALTWGRFLFDVMQTVALVVLWLRKPGKDAGERVASLKAEVDMLRETIRHMPLREELTRLEGSVKAIQSDVNSVRESSAFTRDAVTRIEAFLLQAGSR